MNEGKMAPVETTDCLEAVSVFRGWKNLFFVVLLLSLLLTQAAFWAINLGIVASPVPEVEVAGELPEGRDVDLDALEPPPDGEVGPAEQTPGPENGDLLENVLGEFDYAGLAHAIELVNGILIIAAALFCFALFFSLMVSLVGRLGGIRHVSRAFILSLILLALMLPWQRLLNSTIVGVVWAPAELAEWLESRDDTVVNTVIFYLRFTGYWLVALLLLIMAQARTARWSKAIVRRLEII